MIESKLAGQVYTLNRHGEFSLLELENFKHELGLICPSSPVPEALESPGVDNHLFPELQPSMGTAVYNHPIQSFVDENHVSDVSLQNANINTADRLMLPKLNTVNRNNLHHCI